MYEPKHPAMYTSILCIETPSRRQIYDSSASPAGGNMASTLMYTFIEIAATSTTLSFVLLSVWPVDSKPTRSLPFIMNLLRWLRNANPRRGKSSRMRENDRTVPQIARANTFDGYMRYEAIATTSIEGMKADLGWARALVVVKRPGWQGGSPRESARDYVAI
ncbi:hypothetical protein PENSPDRAFT_722180 [Peniophora sp. CONT]|nr:hypothetical protein PENSPDRAFT_722180 [Peniophora sp. CONT]